MLTYIKEAGPYISPSGKKRRRCVFRCECGKEKVIVFSSVKTGRTKSCGCIQKQQIRERNRKHGFTVRGEWHPLYRIWAGMKGRCYNKSRKDYSRYGGRGIKVCTRWLDSFKNFKDDMSPIFKKGLSLDRVDNSGDYSPENCKWSTKKQQSRNTRTNIVYKGKCIAEWAEDIGIEYNTLRIRVSKLGWSWEKALNTPTKERKCKTQRCG